MKVSVRAILLVPLGSIFGFIALAFTSRGPEYDFPEHSSPGVGMWLREASRDKRGTVRHVVYNLSAMGLTPGRELSLYRWDWAMSDGVLALAGFRVEPDGRVTCSKPPERSISDEEIKHWCHGDLDKVKVDAVDFQPGQALRIGFISTDNEQKAYAEVIPFPIENEDRQCRLVAERLSEDAGTWAIRGEGFKPGEVVHYVWKGPGNSLKRDVKVSEKGSLALMVRPPASGAEGGTVTFKVKAGACEPLLRFSWTVMARR
jgi:hypothetical protein